GRSDGSVRRDGWDRSGNDVVMNEKRTRGESMKPGTTRPTYDDVSLILKLYEMRRDEKLRAARGWFAANFKVKTIEEWQKLCPPGSDPNASYRMVTSYWEMVASFITGGVL